MPELGITLLSRWIFNCYLIHDGGTGAAVIVDAGLPDVAQDLAPHLGPRPSVAAIVATHAHSDHVGGAARVSARTGAPIRLPERALGYLDSALAPRGPSPSKLAAVLPVYRDQPFDPRALVGAARATRIAGYGTGKGMVWTGQPPAASDALIEGHALPAAAEWTVLATPGHTEDSVAFWHESSRTLLCGDAVLTRHGHAWLTPNVVDADAAEITNQRLRKLPVEHLLPGHGRPIHGKDLRAGAHDPGDRPRRRAR